MVSTPLPVSPAVSAGGHFDKTRVRIQAINIDLKATSKYPILLQCLVDNNPLKKQKFEEGRLPHWKVDLPFDITLSSKVEVEIFEKHTLWSSRLRSFNFSGQDVLHACSDIPSGSGELKRSEQGVDITIEFAPLASAVSVDTSQAAVRVAVDATKDLESILSKLSEARSAVEVIMRIGEQLTDIHPISKAAFSAINSAFKHAEKEEIFDNNIRDLAFGMATMLSFIKIVHEFTKIEQLSQTVMQMLKLTEDASRFIVEYLSHGRARRYGESAVSSNSRNRIDEFIKQFKELKEEFDRGIAVQVFGTVVTAEERSILDKLGSVDERCGPSYDDQHVCMDGTRQTVLQDIEQWAVNTTASPPFLWIHGLAGVGKSSIASSIAQRLDNLGEGSCLGATFFCKRDDLNLKNPSLVIPRIASRLASAHKPFGKAVAAALREKPRLVTEAIPLQFKCLIVDTLGKVPAPISGRPFIIVIDAIDECGHSNTTRRQLLSVLHEMAGLVPWLKVIVTSRPDHDIQRFFNTLGTRFRPLDLDREDSYMDILVFTTRRMEEIAFDTPSLPPTWPGSEVIKELARRAGRLFIWARVASDFIANALDVERNLGIVLDEKPGEIGDDPYKHLDQLYKIILEHNIQHDRHSAKIFRHVVGTIATVGTHGPLSIKSLKKFFKGEDVVPPHALDNTIQSLHSVLYEDGQHGNAIRLCHSSFMDFLTNPSRCPPQFFIDLKQQNVNVIRGNDYDRSYVVPLLRAFNTQPGTPDHFYTTDAAEMQRAVTQLGYAAEGTTGYIFPKQEDGTIPLYRLCCASATDHFYTTNATERDFAASSLGYVNEGTVGYVYPSESYGARALFRLYNEGWADHFYTMSTAEMDNAINALGFSFEKIPGYIFPA